MLRLESGPVLFQRSHMVEQSDFKDREEAGNEIL